MVPFLTLKQKLGRAILLWRCGMFAFARQICRGGMALWPRLKSGRELHPSQQDAVVLVPQRRAVRHPPRCFT
jgi:hypothetical protein